MTALAIITIVVIAFLTIVIFGLTWLAYTAVLRTYRLEVNQGLHDDLIRKEHRAKSKKRGLAGIIISYAVLSLLLGLFITGLCYRISGEQFVIGNTTALVIKSGSMSDYYNDDVKAQYELKSYKTLHFDVGDICKFELIPTDSELTIGDVYGYKYKGIIITHRLIDIKDDFYIFQGDNNSIADPYDVKRDAIIYHYTGDKIPGIGAFVLFAQSLFGLWSLFGILGIAISSEVILYKIEKVNKTRFVYLLSEVEYEA